MHGPIQKPAILGISSFSNSDSRATGHLQPQHIGYLSLFIDLALFAAAGLAARPWVAAPQTDFFRMMVLSTVALTLIIFAGCCRASKLHDPLILLHSLALPRITRVIICFGIPALIPLAAGLPLLGAADPAVRSFISWLVSFELLGLSFGIAAHGIFHVALPSLSRHLLARQQVAVIGSGESASRLINWVELTAPGMFDIIGVFDDRDSKRTRESVVADKIRGTTTDLIDLYKRAAFDRIIIALPHSAETRLLNLLRQLRQLPVDIVLAPDLMGFNAAEQGAAEMAGLNLLSLAHRPIRGPQRLFKAAFDFVVALLSVIMLSPLLIGIAIAIKLTSAGPILFRQPRQGLGDTLFHVLKFRTMDADLGDLHGRNQTKRDDPRVTRVGSFLRKTSLDELPQLFNVLCGHMALVGPRPHTPHMLIGDKRHCEIVAEYSFRHRVKPGITGLAQVSGYRGAVDTPAHLKARIDLDLYYIDHWSIWLDFKILCRTVMVCLSGLNAF